MPCGRDRIWHPTQSQYTVTGPTCRCAIHWCGTSHWNTQLPILMSWVRPDREIFLRPSTHTSERDAVKVIISWKLGRKYRTNWVLNPWPMLWEAITLSARPLRLQKRIGSFGLINYTFFSYIFDFAIMSVKVTWYNSYSFDIKYL